MRLSDIVKALGYPEEWECFLDRNTGEVVAITENERPHLEDDETVLRSLPEWLRDSVRKVQEALDSRDLVDLPSRFDVHEWQIMRRFADDQEEPVRADLLDAIHGTGAFRSFRRTTERLDLREAWFHNRDDALKTIARDWLQENGIGSVEE